MTQADQTQVDSRRQRILDSALAELVTKNAAIFTMDAVANRSGVDVSEIKAVWTNTPQLLTDALMRFADQLIPVPDTGTLHGDLLEYSKGYAAAVNDPRGRRLLAALMATPKDWDVSDWRPTFFRRRERRVAVMVERAIERGECVPDADPVRTIDLLAAGLCCSLQFYARPISEADCHYVVDIVTNGIRVRPEDPAE